ncbi:MAG: hypothetical protein H6Q36_490 [Chloroflexi bacterium]|jgi:hypothetical protein|nr:hypothetical protein [Chloroflexota bacterium]
MTLGRATALVPEPEAYRLANARIRRCTYRRLIATEPAPAHRYDVECLFPDRLLPMPLGDLPAATPICNACAAPHIFRADED